MAGFRASNEYGAPTEDCSKSGVVSNNSHERPRNWIIGATIASIAGFVIFLNSLHGDLIFDDVHAIIRNRFDCIVFCLIHMLLVICWNLQGCSGREPALIDLVQ
jgi:hypothetical protein